MSKQCGWECKLYNYFRQLSRIQWSGQCTWLWPRSVSVKYMLSSCTHAKECSVQQCLQLPKLEATQLAISITIDKYRCLYIQVMASQVVLVVKNLLASSGDTRDEGPIPGLGRFPGEGHGNPLQYFCLENLVDRGVWRATVHRVTKSQAWLKWLSMHAHIQVIDR